MASINWTWLLAAVFIAVCAYVAFGGDLSALKKITQSLNHEPAPTVYRTLKGHASVQDGDTLSINGETIRLEGIDAFELSQTCGEMTCGTDARDELVKLTEGTVVTCDDVGRDTYDRVLGLCHTASAQDINEALVLSGHAIAYLYYTNRYEAAQKEARSARRGAWAHDFVEPYEYRRQRRSEFSGGQ